MRSKIDVLSFSRSCGLVLAVARVLVAGFFLRNLGSILGVLCYAVTVRFHLTVDNLVEGGQLYKADK